MPDFSEIITPADWTAMLWITLSSLAATNVVKALWRLCPWLSGETAAKLNSFAFLLGIVFAYFLWPKGGVPWWIGGLVSGLLTPFAYKALNALLLSRFPNVDAAVNYDRRKADPTMLPPSGMTERRDR